MYIPPERLGGGQALGELLTPRALISPAGATIPFALREDFDRDVLDAAWELDAGASFSATPPHAYARLGAGDDARVSINSRRDSFLMIQPPGDEADHYLHRPITIAGDFLIVARVSNQSWGRNNVDPNRAWLCGIAFGASSGGTLDTDNVVRISHLIAIATAIAGETRFEKVEGGVLSNITTSGTRAQKNGWDWSILAIQRRFSAPDWRYYGYITGDDGTWQTFNFGTFAPDVDRVCLWFGNASTPAANPNDDPPHPGTPIVGWDYIYAFDTSDFPY